MSSVHLVRGREGHTACRYCRRDFNDPTEAESHIRSLVKMGMLQDHIAIHWTNAQW